MNMRLHGTVPFEFDNKDVFLKALQQSFSGIGPESLGGIASVPPYIFQSYRNQTSFQKERLRVYT